MAEGAGLENRYTRKGIVGSNPTLSAHPSMSLSRADRLAGCLLGQAAGDALGFVVEGAPPEAAAEYVERWLRAGRRTERAHPQFSIGQYSDDTQLARELLIAFHEAGGFDCAAYAVRIAELFRRGRDVGAGPGTRGAARRLIAGVPWREAATLPPYTGNGSAMRAAPIGLLASGDPGALGRMARDQSAITHGSPVCAAGAVAIAGAVALASRPAPFSRREFLECLAGWVAPADRGLALAILGLEAWGALDPPRAMEHLRRAGLDPGSGGIWRGVPGSVVPSVLWSLYAFLRSPDDYWETVCTAICAGGDTDTTAAMAGAMAGARAGPGAVPDDVAGALHDRGEWRAADLERLARRSAAILEGEPEVRGRGPAVGPTGGGTGG